MPDQRENLEINGGSESLELIAQTTQPLQAIINIKKASLPTHQTASHQTNQSES